MSDNICPKCNTKNNESSNFCKNCGFSFDNQKPNLDEIKSNFFNFTEDIAFKIQNKLEKEDMLKTNDILERINNLDEDSLNRLLDKYGISPSKLKLLDKVDINKLKDDLIEFGIITPKPDSDVKTVKPEVIIEDEDNCNDFHENDVHLVEEVEVEEEPYESFQNHNDESSKINVCSKCGFENRSQVKFCTNCGNKL